MSVIFPEISDIFFQIPVPADVSSAGLSSIRIFNPLKLCTISQSDYKFDCTGGEVFKSLHVKHLTFLYQILFCLFHHISQMLKLILEYFAQNRIWYFRIVSYLWKLMSHKGNALEHTNMRLSREVLTIYTDKSPFYNLFRISRQDHSLHCAGFLLNAVEMWLHWLVHLHYDIVMK